MYCCYEYISLSDYHFFLFTSLNGHQTFLNFNRRTLREISIQVGRMREGYVDPGIAVSGGMVWAERVMVLCLHSVVLPGPIGEMPICWIVGEPMVLSGR